MATKCKIAGFLLLFSNLCIDFCEDRSMFCQLDNVTTTSFSHRSVGDDMTLRKYWHMELFRLGLWSWDRSLVVIGQCTVELWQHRLLWRRMNLRRTSMFTRFEEKSQFWEREREREPFARLQRFLWSMTTATAGVELFVDGSASKDSWSMYVLDTEHRVLMRVIKVWFQGSRGALLSHFAPPIKITPEYRNFHQFLTFCRIW